ncbi:glucosamine-6-phosphate deaminase [Sulfuriroseicoccus oceanibius]|uniref:Glucosamine-6-phosphate deaminase n=1 Tax=Sulfuriroseicoccus oceanibius TaxID=2707525 RepID=A0A6B3LDX4_9BACT|nr:glucosamine-6-phosphate deaminase [Sulfuriroseicoccus oceanibius]QQL44719.1 glucosamine-6-phosphate deaminase [Sulfuriroseicoccus oceanibius]
MSDSTLNKTPVTVFESPEAAAKALAAEFAELIKSRAAEGKTAVLGLATGSTPLPFYAELIRLHKEEGLSFANVVTFNLDEYSGLPREHKESYWHFMHENLFNHIDIPAENVNLPSGTVAEADVPAHCDEYEKAIVAAGGIDFQILGIGRTGHIGFNEPGSPKDSRTRAIHLDEITRQDAAPAFDGIDNVPTSAITMGCGTILDAKKIVLMSWGEKKAAITKEAVQGPISDQVSASFLQEHPDARFFVDTAAASLL